MNIEIKWFDGKYPSFNVALSSVEGKDPFLEVKGCRIVEGKDGEFVSTPSTKNEKTGKYWNHAYFSKDFSAVVLEKAKECQPRASKVSPKKDDFHDDIPW